MKDRPALESGGLFEVSQAKSSTLPTVDVIEVDVFRPRWQIVSFTFLRSGGQIGARNEYGIFRIEEIPCGARDLFNKWPEFFIVLEFCFFPEKN